MSSVEPIVARLAAVIERRHRERPADSYTTTLFEAGHTVMASKLIEEAYELVAAAGEEYPSAGDVIHEAADLLYHLLVLLTASGCRWTDVERELERRFGVSGLTEKTSRMQEPT